MRDLLAALGIDRVTVVGHSFGGGVAMQFAYQYPQLVERVVLVSAGGVAKDVSLALRLAAMPMGAEALGVLRAPGVLPAIRCFGRAVGSVLGSTRLGRDAADVVGMLEGFGDPAGLAAFARTLRSVVDARGQFVTMLDRTYLVQSLPVQIIWGEDDLIIPLDHAHKAHEAIPGSRVEIFEESGHMPFHDHPDRFVEVVERFIDSTQPADHDFELMRSMLRTGGREDLAPGSVAVASANSAVS
jgi:pimeloyl-ACP methyl ester carboxylesterase